MRINIYFKNFFSGLLLLIIFLEAEVTSFTIDCINIPTAEVIDYGVSELNVRLYNGGGTNSKLVFAPFNRVNFGGSIDIDKLIGKDTPEIRDPQFYFKWRIFDGTKNLPALAIGYDGQGYEYDDNSRKYLQPAKGLFLVFTINIFTKGMFYDFGVNVVKYNDINKTLGFIGVRYLIEEVLVLMFEYENLGSDDLNQLNSGFGIILSEHLILDFLFKNLYPKRNGIEIDRQMRISYKYKFF